MRSGGSGNGARSDGRASGSSNGPLQLPVGAAGIALIPSSQVRSAVPMTLEPRFAEVASSAPTCERCGSVIAARRRPLVVNSQLCARCEQRARRSAYFRLYYETHKGRILDKNRRWARDNKERLRLLRRARLERQPPRRDEPRACIDCGTSVARALRCRKCYIRFRYATDTDYRVRRLATTRRWLQRRLLRRQAEQGAVAMAVGSLRILE